MAKRVQSLALAVLDLLPAMSFRLECLLLTLIFTTVASRCTTAVSIFAVVPSARCSESKRICGMPAGTKLPSRNERTRSFCGADRVPAITPDTRVSAGNTLWSTL